MSKFKGSLSKEQVDLYTEGSIFELGVRGRRELGSLSGRHSLIIYRVNVYTRGS